MDQCSFEVKMMGRKTETEKESMQKQKNEQINNKYEYNL